MLIKGLKLYKKSEDKETKHIVTAINIYLQLKEPTKIKHYLYQIFEELKLIEFGRFQKELIELIYLEMLKLCYIEQAYG
jgi:hypothetical protein